MNLKEKKTKPANHMFEIWTMFVGVAKMTERQKDAGSFRESYPKAPPAEKQSCLL